MNISPYAYAIAVTPSNTANFGPIGSKVLQNNLVDAIWVGGAGQVDLVQADGSVASFTVATVPAIIPVRALRVNATSTATKMLALVF